MRRAGVVASLVAFVVGACASGTTPAPSTTMAASAVPRESAAAAVELPPDTVDLPPARYARPDLLPGVSFEVEDGWSSGMVGDGRFQLSREVGPGEVIVMLARTTAGSASAAADAIGAMEGISVLATSESRMNGRTGPNLELESTADARVDLLTTASGAIGLEPGERAWLSLFDTGGGVVAVTVIADAGTWDAALLAAEPLLETVEIAD